jgi:hypothetical protein
VFDELPSARSRARFDDAEPDGSQPFIEDPAYTATPMKMDFSRERWSPSWRGDALLEAQRKVS